MTDYKFISEKRCQICNVNREDIKLAFDYINSDFQYKDNSNNQQWKLSVKRVDKYNNGDYKDFIDEYNSHWFCLPKVNQMDYNERIEIANKKQQKEPNNELNDKYKLQIQRLYEELDKKNNTISKLHNNNNELIKNIDNLQNENNILSEMIEKLKINNINLTDNKNYLKDENSELRSKIDNLQNIIYQKDDEINYLRSQYEKKVTIDYEAIKKRNKNLNNEFKRVAKLMKLG